jgi:four helix bundle protein
MNEKAEQLKARTAAFARTVADLCSKATVTDASRIITCQLIAAATSVAANYRAACRPRSRREFIAKIGVVREEADEAHAIFDSSFHTAKRRFQQAAGQRITKSRITT